MVYVLLIVGFILLIKGADFFVEGSSSIAKRMQIPVLIIGMTIVAMGTSLPECAVSITASIKNSNSMAISNVIGSNIFNLMIVSGTCALFHPLTVKKQTLQREFPFSILIALFLLLLGIFDMKIGRIDGILLLVVFLTFLMWMIKRAKNSRNDKETETKVFDREVTNTQDTEKYHIYPVWQCAVFVVGGAIAVAVGGDMVVDCATLIAQRFGLSETLIGLTIVAFGTSLPELVTSLVAARKGEVDMALGNVIGSNIFNILFVLGISAAVSAVEVTMLNLIDLGILLGVSVAVWAVAYKENKIKVVHGIFMIAAYVMYVVYICMR